MWRVVVWCVADLQLNTEADTMFTELSGGTGYITFERYLCLLVFECVCVEQYLDV